MGTEIHKCECEHSNHDELECRGVPMVMARTEYGWFALCHKCLKAMHMVGLNDKVPYKEIVAIDGELTPEYRKYLVSDFDPRD